MKLYYTEASPPCRTVILIANLLNIELELTATAPKKGETTTPAFLKINPQHVVPTLIDDDKYIIWESRAIGKYLVSKYAKDDALYPADFYKRMEVDKVLDFDLGTVWRRVTDYFVTCLFSGKFDEGKKPKIEDALSILNTVLERNGSGYVCGDCMTIADISLLTTITSLEVIDYDLSKYNYVRNWLSKIKNLIPNYDVNGFKGELAFKQMINEYLK